MHWILQSNLFGEKEWDNLVTTLDRFELPYSVHKVIPFIGELVPAAEPKQEKVICFGSYSMRHSARENNWKPGVYDLEPFNFNIQMQHWGSHMLNHRARVTKFSDVKYNEGEELLFLRPIEDSKVFAGKVFERAEFEDWQNKVCVLEEDFGNSLTKDTLVQACEPLNIYAEYRFWVVDKKIVCASLYKRGGKVIYSDEVGEKFHAYVTERIWDWAPLPAFVIDVCDTEDGIKIVEINTINAAGFYAADMQKLVMSLEELERHG